MTKQEFALLAQALRTYYPKEDKLLPNREAMALWYEALGDLPYPVAKASLQKWAETNKWSPSIAEWREAAASVTHGEIPGWGDGWEQVLRAIRMYGMYNPGAALASMDPLTRKAVERVGFREICMSENIATDRANFRMVYENLAEREKTQQQISLPLQKAINRLQSGGALQIEGGVPNGGRERLSAPGETH